MSFASIIDTVGGIAQVGEPLYFLLETESIPTEDIRKAMVAAAFRHELEAGRVREGHKDVAEYRKLRKFLQKAPIGVALGETDDVEIPVIPNFTELELSAA
jgi:hypothetical protein